MRLSNECLCRQRCLGCCQQEKVQPAKPGLLIGLMLKEILRSSQGQLSAASEYLVLASEINDVLLCRALLCAGEQQARAK